MDGALLPVPGKGHLFVLRTHMFVSSLMTVPLGHSQRGTHCLVHIGLGVVQLGGQADPHLLNI